MFHQHIIATEYFKFEELFKWKRKVLTNFSHDYHHPSAYLLPPPMFSFVRSSFAWWMDGWMMLCFAFVHGECDLHTIAGDGEGNLNFGHIIMRLWWIVFAFSNGLVNIKHVIPYSYFNSTFENVPNRLAWWIGSIIVVFHGSFFQHLLFFVVCG